MSYAVLNEHSLRWLWQKAEITDEEAQENAGHVRSVMAVIKRLDNPIGEHFSVRGIGLNWRPCYVCRKDGEQPDMAAFVQDREAGERVVELFKQAGCIAQLDFRAHEPRRVQVKIGACVAHEANLRLLEVTTSLDLRITVERIKYSLPSVFSRRNRS